MLFPPVAHCRLAQLTVCRNRFIQQFPESHAEAEHLHIGGVGVRAVFLPADKLQVFPVENRGVEGLLLLR